MSRWEPNARGRLKQAALALYGERGFEHTTVAEIAERAGLTERTFFRHFADKREVLFAGAGALQELLVSTVASAPESAGADRRGRRGPRGRRRSPSGAPRARPPAPGDHRREHRASRARADQARLTRRRARRRVAPARRRGPSREPDRRGRDRRLQGRVSNAGSTRPTSGLATTHPRIAGRAESRDRGPIVVG